MEHNKTSFVLTGFSHDRGFRVFEFDCVKDGRMQTRHTVRADLALARKYGIHLQELPLLCRRLLDACEKGSRSSLTLPEAEMIACAQEASRVQSRKPWKRPAVTSGDGVDENLPSGTRGPQTLVR